MTRLLGPLAVVLIALAGPVAAQDTPPTITVTGEGRVEAAPDMATIRLGVTSEGRAAREANGARP